MSAVGPLRWDARLQAAAERHSKDMAARQVLPIEHVGTDGSTPADRIRDTGYPMVWPGENIAAGYHDIPDVVTGWMGSEGHCATIMRPFYEDMGAACSDRGGVVAKYWTLVFGSTTPLQP